MTVGATATPTVFLKNRTYDFRKTYIKHLYIRYFCVVQDVRVLLLYLKVTPPVWIFFGGVFQIK